MNNQSLTVNRCITWQILSPAVSPGSVPECGHFRQCHSSFWPFLHTQDHPASAEVRNKSRITHEPEPDLNNCNLLEATCSESSSLECVISHEGLEVKQGWRQRKKIDVERTSQNYNLNEAWNSISLCKKGKQTWVMLLCQYLAEVVNLLEPGKWHTTLGKVKFKMTNKDQHSVSFSRILSIQYIGVEGILHTVNRTKNSSTIRSNNMKFPLKGK